MSKYGVFSGPYFSPYFVNLRIQSEYRKIRTGKTFIFRHFSRSVGLVSVVDYSLTVKSY